MTKHQKMLTTDSVYLLLHLSPLSLPSVCAMHVVDIKILEQDLVSGDTGIFQVPCPINTNTQQRPAAHHHHHHLVSCCPQSISSTCTVCKLSYDRKDVSLRFILGNCYTECKGPTMVIQRP